MLELAHWLSTTPFPVRPWLLLGTGPTFDRRGELPIDGFLRLSLGHAVREQSVEVAHIPDVEALARCGAALQQNAQWLLMPRFPRRQGRSATAAPLESFFTSHPVLREFESRGRLVGYDLQSPGCPVLGSTPPIPMQSFGAEAALEVLGRLGAKIVRTLGIDGGRSYSQAFRDIHPRDSQPLEQPSYDVQFERFFAIAAAHGIDCESLIPPMRIFVGGDATEHVAAKVLEHTIRKHASGPVRVTIMRDYAIPVPKAPKNRARTKFSFYRFKIPELCGHRDRALYVDSDMQVFTDVAELWKIPFGHRKLLCTRQDTPPAAWRDNSWFKPGRQFSVMLLDCDRLPWRIEDVIGGLDAGRYAYGDLMFKMCLVGDEEIGDDLPPRWNHLETHVPGETSLTHFTVVPTQPWKTDDTPLNELWMRAYAAAVADGVVDPDHVREGIAKGYYKRGLEAALATAPAFWTGAKRSRSAAGDPDTGRQPVPRSWLSRVLTRPFDLLKRSAAALRDTAN